MKTSLKSLLTLAALAATSLTAQAQVTPKIVVIDMNKVITGYYRTTEESTKMQTDQKSAQTRLEGLQKELSDIAEQYKESVEATKSPALSADAKTKAETDAVGKAELGRKKELEIRDFQQRVGGELQQRRNAYLQSAVEEASKVATDIAKKKGANMILERSANAITGTVVYADPSFDISDEVLAEMNKGRPAAAAPAATPAADGTAPAITFPGTKK